MDKEFKEGSLALVQKQEVIENGEIGLIAVKELDTVIRKVFINNSLITLMPQSNNLKYQPQTYDMAKEDVHVIGKVILAVNKY
jgi:repressor LexA